MARVHPCATERKARTLRPRATAAIAVSPVTATDLTCALVFGLEPRTFRWLLVNCPPAAKGAPRGVPHAELGRRLIVRVEDVLAALDRLAAAPVSDTAAADMDVDDEELEDVDALLARVGRRRIAGAGR